MSVTFFFNYNLIGIIKLVFIYQAVHEDQLVHLKESKNYKFGVS